MSWRFLRRIAVIAMYGAYAAGAVLQWRVHTIGENRQLILGIFVFAFAVGAGLFASTHHLRWIAAKEAKLDERERAARNEVYRSAYHIIAWSGVALLAVWYLVPLWAQPLTPATNGSVLFWGYVLLTATLPAALLAWRDRPVS